MSSELTATLSLALISVFLIVGWQWLRQKDIHRAYSEQWLGHIAQFFYFVGIPYLAVILGLITPRFLGLKGVDHFALINWQSEVWIIHLQQALTLLLLECLLDIPVILFTGAIALLIFGSIWMFLARQQVTVSMAHISVLDIIFLLLHWAFYRAIFWFITDNLYLGVVMGSALAIFELMLMHWVCRRNPFGQQQVLVTAILLVLTSAVFFYSPNLWLLFPLSWLMVVIINLNQLPSRSGDGMSINGQPDTEDYYGRIFSL